MSKRIYVGNLPFNLTLEKLKELFSEYGAIKEATIVTNKFSGRSKGFGFVEFEDDTAGEASVSAMNNKSVDGREIVVKEAMPFDPDKPRKCFGRSEFGSRDGGDRRGPRRPREKSEDSSEDEDEF